jgi:hypothetical protein
MLRTAAATRQRQRHETCAAAVSVAAADRANCLHRARRNKEAGAAGRHGTKQSKAVHTHARVPSFHGAAVQWSGRTCVRHMPHSKIVGQKQQREAPAGWTETSLSSFRGKKTRRICCGLTHVRTSAFFLLPIDPLAVVPLCLIVEHS